MGTESVRDIKYDFLAAKQGGAEKTHEFFATKLAEKLRKIEGSLPPTTETDACPWLVGSRFSYADLCYFGFLTDARAGVVEHLPFIANKDATTQAFQESCPRIKVAVEAVAAIPQVRTYSENRKETMR